MSAITKRERINRKIAAGVTKMTPETIGKLKQAFAIDCTIEEACLYAEIHKDTYYTWVKKHPELSDQFDTLREKPVLKARQEVVMNLIGYGNSMDYLSRKRPHEFAGRQKIEQSVKVEEVESEDTNEIREIVKSFDQKLKEIIAKKHGK